MVYNVTLLLRIFVTIQVLNDAGRENTVLNLELSFSYTSLKHDQKHLSILLFNPYLVGEVVTSHLSKR